MEEKLNAQLSAGLEEKKVELTEKQLRRLELLDMYNRGEKLTPEYAPEEGIYDVKISNITLKTNKNGNSFIQFRCKNNDENNSKLKTLYASYYLTDIADDYSICDLNVLLNDYGFDCFTKEEVIDDYNILTKLQGLVGKNAKLQIEDQDGFMSGKIHKELVNA